MKWGSKVGNPPDSFRVFLGVGFDRSWRRGFIWLDLKWLELFIVESCVVDLE